MKLVCKIQTHLVLAYRKEDKGDFFFVLCRAGFEHEIGKRFSIGDVVEVEVNLKAFKVVDQ